MSPKAFILWGLVVINLTVALTAIIQYLGHSKMFNINALDFNVYRIISDVTTIAFAALLFLRFKNFPWRRKQAALCISVPLFIVFTMIGSGLALVYVMGLEPITGAYDRFFDPITAWTNLDEPKPLTPWTVKHRVVFVLYHIPVMYLTRAGFFALLWFGSLDPQTPSKNRFVQFFKTALSGKLAPNVSVKKAQSRKIMA